MYPGHPQHGCEKTTDQLLETQHNVRRLPSHPSIVIWDGENGDDGGAQKTDGGAQTGTIAKLAMTWLTAEDRLFSGWLSGVDPSTGRPLFPLQPLVLQLPTGHRVPSDPGHYGTSMPLASKPSTTARGQGLLVFPEALPDGNRC